MTAERTPTPCAVCGRPLTAEDDYIYHARLGVFVCMGCPQTNVCGEDITDHTVMWHIASRADL